MKVKCSFCLIRYDLENNQGYCPDCGKKFDDKVDNLGEEFQGFAPYGEESKKSETGTDRYSPKNFQGYEKPNYMNHSTIDPPSMGAYRNAPKNQGVGRRRVAVIAIAVTVIFIACFVALVFSTTKGNDGGNNNYPENSRQEAHEKIITPANYPETFQENYTQGDMEGASSKKQIEALIADFQGGRLSGRAQFDGFILQWLYFNSKADEKLEVLEQAAKDCEDKTLLAEVYLLHYNMLEDESYLELAQSAMTPEEYFSETDRYGALPEILEKEYSDITWKDIGRFTHVSIAPSVTGGTAFDEEGTELYSTTLSNELWGYGAFGFYGATNLSVEEGDYHWGIPFYMTQLESLKFANTHIGMSLEHLDYFTKLTNVAPAGVALSDPDVQKVIKTTTMELDRNATQADANELPGTIINLKIDDSDEISNLDFLDGLSNLETLSITGTNITDFAPLYSKMSLTELVLVNTNIKEVSFLESFEELTALTLERNDQLLSCKGIETCASLEKLVISGDLEGIEGISALSGLTTLELSRPKTISYIADLKELKELTIFGGGMLENIQGISGLSKLEHLNFSGGTIGTTFYFEVIFH